MSIRHKETIQKEIRKNGLYETSRLLGISMTHTVKLSGIKIIPKYANEVLLEMLYKGQIPNVYKQFTVEYDGESAVRWYGHRITNEFGLELKETIYCMATPFFGGKGVTPIDFDFYDLSTLENNDNIFSYDNYGEYQEILVHEIEFENIEKLLEWFRDFYLPTVYEKIMTECIPQVIEQNKEEIYDSINEYFDRNLS